MIDVASPASAVTVAFCDTPGHARAVATAGNYACVGDGQRGLQVMIASDPANLTEVAFYDAPGAVSGVAVAGNRAYAADGGAGRVCCGDANAYTDPNA